MYCCLTFYIYTSICCDKFFIPIHHLPTNIKVGNIGVPHFGREMVECIYLVAALVLPMAYMWLPIQDQSYLVLSCDNNNSQQWNEDAIVFNTLVLIMCMEVAAVFTAFSGLFCYLCWRLKNRRLSNMLKYFIIPHNHKHSYNGFYCYGSSVQHILIL